MEINFAKIEKKWQDKWETNKVFEVSSSSGKEKYYILEMFPYPSGTGLHMGHALNYTIGDILARFKIMNGFNVLHPMGYDALGLPAENAAIKAGTHPQKYTNDAIVNFMKQQKALGVSYDWSRIVNTASPDYYKWDQWIFLKMFEKGLAYQKTGAVNWCSKCNTVLANEQVEDGKCWRHEDTEVDIKHLKQWFFKTTEYANELYENLDNMDWPERTKAMQKNWIGKSHGTEINFEINKEKWSIFTTRPDTIFGVTFMVVAAQHPRLNELVTPEQKDEVDAFLKKVKSVSEKDAGDLEKEGAFTGSYATNPATGEKIPIYTGNFVLADYGSGMVMAVPAHDQRDFEFAKKYGIEIKQVIRPIYGDPHKDAIHRNTISAVVHRKNDNKFLALKWKEFKWISPVIGGIKDGESIEDAAIREVLEETGYNTKFIRKLGNEIESHFYAENKKVWRSRIDQPVLLELIDDQPGEVDCEEKERHEAIWLSSDEALDNTTHKDNNAGLLIHLGKEQAYTGSGKLINSDKLNDLDNQEAKEKITEWLSEKGIAKKTTNFKLRDWGISRQRYWGTPIPIIHCDKCGAVPVPEKDLPVEIPKDVKFGDGNPLETAKDWINVKCPKCGQDGKRETDTMDTFVNSSWYFMRYCDPNNNDKIFDTEKANYWCPIDTYIGGAEHACMHLIYVRFYTKFLRDLGLINFDEPAIKLFHQGMLHAEDGKKMSKSLGNVVDPLDTVKKYGVDATRFFLVSVASPDKNFDWSEKEVAGTLRFLIKIINLYDNVKIGTDTKELLSTLNQAIKDTSKQFDSFDYRAATIKLRELFDLLAEQKEASKETLESALKILNPICPHITEELWEKLGNKNLISTSEWPKADESKIIKKGQVENLNEKIIEDIKYVLEKVISTHNSVPSKKGTEIPASSGKIYIYVMPFELGKIDKKEIEEVIQKEVEIFAVNDPNKHDPEQKAKRAKPGKASIYVE